MEWQNECKNDSQVDRHTHIGTANVGFGIRETYICPLALPFIAGVCQQGVPSCCSWTHSGP
jgi:hypothetical protein